MADGGSGIAIDEDIPRATARVLRAIAVHPSVRGIEAVHDGAGACTIATISIDTDLPSRWRSRGHADNGILAVEPVTLVFGRGFPLVAPAIRFREDFDGSHPHLLPREPGAAPEPCLVLGSPAELIRARGFPGLINQLVDWLRKAALIQLIDPTIGWEPTRRDHVRDHVVADLEPLRALPGRDPGSAVYETRLSALPTVPPSSCIFRVAGRSCRRPGSICVTRRARDGMVSRAAISATVTRSSPGPDDP